MLIVRLILVIRPILNDILFILHFLIKSFIYVLELKICINYL